MPAVLVGADLQLRDNHLFDIARFPPLNFKSKRMERATGSVPLITATSTSS